MAFVVDPFPDEAFVQVKSTQGHGLSGDIIVKVSLTSPVVREEQLAAAAAAAVVSNGICYFNVNSIEGKQNYYFFIQ